MSGLHGEPTAAELVEAVREYLERDVLESTDGRVRFHARVAINVLGMVERELASGPAMTVAHAARLHALGYTDDESLAAAIRAGEVDDRWDEVKAAVTASVIAKLEVANPQYLHRP